MWWYNLCHLTHGPVLGFLKDFVPPYVKNWYILRYGYWYDSLFSVQCKKRPFSDCKSVLQSLYWHRVRHTISLFVVLYLIIMSPHVILAAIWQTSFLWPSQLLSGVKEQFHHCLTLIVECCFKPYDCKWMVWMVWTPHFLSLTHVHTYTHAYRTHSSMQQLVYTHRQNHVHTQYHTHMGERM